MIGDRFREWIGNLKRRSLHSIIKVLPGSLEQSKCHRITTIQVAKQRGSGSAY